MFGYCTLLASPSPTVQWNLSIEDTVGTQLPVLYKDVSLIQR